MEIEWMALPPRPVPRRTVNIDKTRVRFNSSCLHRLRRRDNANPRRQQGCRRHRHPRVLLADRVRGPRHGHRQHRENGNEVQTFILYFNFPFNLLRYGANNLRLFIIKKHVNYHWPVLDPC